MAELEHKYCPTTRLSGRIRVGNVLSYHENKNIAFSSMAKVFGKVTKISTKGKKAPSPEVASLTINERILSFNFNYTGVFSSLCDKPCYTAFEISALNSKFIVFPSSVAVLGAVVNVRD